MKWTILSLLILSFSTLAAEKVTFESLTDLSEAIRDPVFTSKQRKEYLEFTRKMMVKKLAEELAVQESDLNSTFLKTPSKSAVLMGDPWFDLQTQFYITLHQENFNERWNDLQKFVKFTDYGTNIYKAMMGHLASYSPISEGRYYQRWHQVNIVRDGKKRKYNIPYFLLSRNVNDLISMEAHTPFEELIPKNEFAAFTRNIKNFTRVQAQELAEKHEFNKRIFLRALANASKTIATLNYLSGAVSREETEKKVTRFLDRHCVICSEKEKKDNLTGAMNYVDYMQKDGVKPNLTEVTKGFCNSLVKNKYHWNVDELKPLPRDLLLDQTKFADYYVVHKLKKKNKEAIANTILSEDMGILFVTSALTVLDKRQDPIAMRLRCEPSSRAHDNRLVVAATLEAQKNIETYVNTVIEKINTAKYNIVETDKLLEFFVQTNPSATIEATSFFPQGIGWTLKTIAILDKDVNRRAKIDNIVEWGGLIVGMAITFTGIGAPEGLAMVFASASLLRGASTGTYFLVRSKQEKAFMKHLKEARNGTNGVMNESFEFHFNQYKSNKVQFIKEFGQTAFSFGTLYRKALKNTGGDIEKTNRVMKKALITLKLTTKEESFEAIQELIIGLAISI